MSITPSIAQISAPQSATFSFAPIIQRPSIDRVTTGLHPFKDTVPMINKKATPLSSRILGLTDVNTLTPSPESRVSKPPHGPEWQITRAKPIVTIDLPFDGAISRASPIRGPDSPLEIPHATPLPQTLVKSITPKFGRSRIPNTIDFSGKSNRYVKSELVSDSLSLLNEVTQHKPIIDSPIIEPDFSRVQRTSDQKTGNPKPTSETLTISGSKLLTHLQHVDITTLHNTIKRMATEGEVIITSENPQGVVLDLNQLDLTMSAMRNAQLSSEVISMLALRAFSQIATRYGISRLKEEMIEPVEATTSKDGGRSKTQSTTHEQLSNPELYLQNNKSNFKRDERTNKTRLEHLEHAIEKVSNSNPKQPIKGADLVKHIPSPKEPDSDIVSKLVRWIEEITDKVPRDGGYNDLIKVLEREETVWDQSEEANTGVKQLVSKYTAVTAELFSGGNNATNEEVYRVIRPSDDD